MHFLRFAAIFLVPVGIASAAPMGGGVFTSFSSLGSVLTLSGELPGGEDYWLRWIGEAGLSTDGSPTGGAFEFDREFGSFYSAQAVVGGKYYPRLYTNFIFGCCPNSSWMRLETDRVPLTEEFIYHIPFRISGAIFAYDSQFPPYNCILCVHFSGSGSFPITTVGDLESPERYPISQLVLRWGDYAVPEPGSISLVAVGAVLLAGDFVRRRLRFGRR